MNKYNCWTLLLLISYLATIAKHKDEKFQRKYHVIDSISYRFRITYSCRNNIMYELISLYFHQQMWYEGNYTWIAIVITFLLYFLPDCIFVGLHLLCYIYFWKRIMYKINEWKQCAFAKIYRFQSNPMCHFQFEFHYIFFHAKFLSLLFSLIIVAEIGFIIVVLFTFLCSPMVK